MAPVTRTAPDGSKVRVTIPKGLGTFQWSGIARIAGKDFNRTFHISEAGQHRLIPEALPGARITTQRRRGHDVIIYEAADRSQTCLVLAGPHNEAVTWFDGPAPRRDVLGRIIRTVRFTDSPSGAQVRPVSRSLFHEYGTQLLAENDKAVLMIRSTVDGMGALPEGRGTVLGGRELWKKPLDLDPDQQAVLNGTPYPWRYILASESAVTDVIFPAPEDRARALAAKAQHDITAALTGLAVRWAA